MLKRYVDDVNTVVQALKPGTKYNATEEKLEIVEEKVEDDHGKEVDKITMEVFGEVANSVDPDIEVEIDYPSKNEGRMMPILDMKMSMNQQNEVVYMFYRKPQCNKFTMMERSALPDKVKRSTMTNEALRRLLCCSPELEEHKRIEVMEEYAKMLRRSGYSEKFRFEVISDAVQGFQKMVKRENEGGQPVNRPKDFEEERGKEDKVVQERTTRY